MFREVFEKILYTDGIVLGSLYIQPTFLESYDFSGAIVISFCTSGSSGIAISESNIRNLGVEYGELLSGKRFSVSSIVLDLQLDLYREMLNMNMESIVILCIILGLLILSVVRCRRTQKSQCSGCAFQCSKKKSNFY